ncbi:MAG: FAD binding domain-containing protein [Oscillospiraceae bacterium]|jgi:xanthine dehydrogenase YagS FAD-binding subunit|nr:FAD binding domain-containing protein [Oscillospiraceae bacterium]
MRPFNHINANSLDTASELVKSGGAVAIAGGGDLLPALKDNIFPEYPKIVVNLKSIPGLDYITLDGDTLKIGALATLADIARSPLVQANAPILARAAGSASSPSLRETTTIGGNVCQLPRCWYFRKLNNRFDCSRKGGGQCFAIMGDNRYHSVFGGAGFNTDAGEKRTCIAVNQSELAPVLNVLTAKFVTTGRVIGNLDFFGVGVLTTTVLNRGELLKEIQIPLTDFAKNSRYKRFAFRKSIDFPVINLAIAVNSDRSQYHICLGGVAPTPYIALKAEELLNGKTITPELAEAAGIAAAEGAKPFEANAYKVQLIKTLVKRELLTMT